MAGWPVGKRDFQCASTAGTTGGTASGPGWDPNQKKYQLGLSADQLTATYTQSYVTGAGVRAAVGQHASGNQAVFMIAAMPAGGAMNVGLSTAAHQLYNTLTDSTSVGLTQDGTLQFNGGTLQVNLGALQAGDIVVVRLKNYMAYFRRNSGTWNGDHDGATSASH